MYDDVYPKPSTINALCDPIMHNTIVPGGSRYFNKELPEGKKLVVLVFHNKSYVECYSDKLTRREMVAVFNRFHSVELKHPEFKDGLDERLLEDEPDIVKKYFRGEIKHFLNPGTM